jgi:hypothetical protein
MKLNPQTLTTDALIRKIFKTKLSSAPFDIVMRTEIEKHFYSNHLPPTQILIKHAIHSIHLLSIRTRHLLLPLIFLTYFMMLIATMEEKNISTLCYETNHSYLISFAILLVCSLQTPQTFDHTTYQNDHTRQFSMAVYTLINQHTHEMKQYVDQAYHCMLTNTEKEIIRIINCHHNAYARGFKKPITGDFMIDTGIYALENKCLNKTARIGIMILALIKAKTCSRVEVFEKQSQFSLSSAKHIFLVLDRDKNTDATDIHSWNKDAMIVDTSHKIQTTAYDIHKNLSRFFNQHPYLHPKGTTIKKKYDTASQKHIRSVYKKKKLNNSPLINLRRKTM